MEQPIKEPQDGFLIFKRPSRDIEAGRIKTWLWHKYYDWETKNIQRRRAEFKAMLGINPMSTEQETILATRDMLIVSEMENQL